MCACRSIDRIIHADCALLLLRQVWCVDLVVTQAVFETRVRGLRVFTASDFTIVQSAAPRAAALRSPCLRLALLNAQISSQWSARTTSIVALPGATAVRAQSSIQSNTACSCRMLLPVDLVFWTTVRYQDRSISYNELLLSHRPSVGLLSTCYVGTANGIVPSQTSAKNHVARWSLHCLQPSFCDFATQQGCPGSSIFLVAQHTSQGHPRPFGHDHWLAPIIILSMTLTGSCSYARPRGQQNSSKKTMLRHNAAHQVQFQVFKVCSRIRDILLI